MFRDIKSQATNPEVGKIISCAAFDGSTEGVAKEAAKYQSSDSLNFYGWLDSERIVGICGFETHADKVEIHLISVAKDMRGKGIGGAMVTALQKMYRLPTQAETDGDAVDFYRKLGFITTAFKHETLGERHICVLKR